MISISICREWAEHFPWVIIINRAIIIDFTFINYRTWVAYSGLATFVSVCYFSWVFIVNWGKLSFLLNMIKFSYFSVYRSVYPGVAMTLVIIYNHALYINANRFYINFIPLLRILSMNQFCFVLVSQMIGDMITLWHSGSLSRRLTKIPIEVKG